jgi:hypothetical protein
MVSGLRAAPSLSMLSQLMGLASLPSTFHPRARLCTCRAQLPQTLSWLCHFLLTGACWTCTSAQCALWAGMIEPDVARVVGHVSRVYLSCNKQNSCDPLEGVHWPQGNVQTSREACIQPYAQQ